MIWREVLTRLHQTKRGKKDSMARLTDEEFRAWCQRNQIAPTTEAYIQRIRESSPARKVRSGASNVSGRYPSVKMGFSIQFESQHVELWGIYAMEWHDKNGSGTSFWMSGENSNANMVTSGSRSMVHCWHTSCSR